jgi:hypothetical protein
MNQLFKFFSQILLLLIFIEQIKMTHAAVNYKLTSFDGRFEGNVSLWVGKRQAVIDYAVDWCNSSFGWFFDLDLNKTWAAGSVPLMSWVPILCGGVYQAGVIRFINNGTYDGYINQFSDRLKKWLAGPDRIYGTTDDRRAYLRLGRKFDRIKNFDRKTINDKNFVSMFSS